MSTWETDTLLNEALILYIGYDTSAFPQYDTKALVKRYGAERASDLELIIDQLSSEMRILDDELDMSTSQDRSAVLTEVIGDSYPRLSETAVKALVWTLRYETR